MLEESKLGPDHPETLRTRDVLAMNYGVAGRMGEQISLRESTLKLRESKLGPDHSDTLMSYNALVNAYRAAGRYADLLALEESTLKQRQSKLSPDHALNLDGRNSLAQAYRDVGRLADAEPLFRKVWEARARALGFEHPATLDTENHWGLCLAMMGRREEAERHYKYSLENICKAEGAPADWADVYAQRLVSLYQGWGKPQEALSVARDAVAQRRKDDKPDRLLLANALSLLGSTLFKQSKWSEAEPILRECLAIREKMIPVNWLRFSTASLLGGTLLGQGKYADAEPLVVVGYEGMKAREAKIPADGKFRLFEATDRVVQLYQAWRKPEKARE